MGEEVELQWKGRRSHPFGWWLGTVQSVQDGRITLVFRWVAPALSIHARMLRRRVCRGGAAAPAAAFDPHAFTALLGS